MNIHAIKMRLAPGLLVAVLSGCAVEPPSADLEEAVIGEDEAALQEDAVAGDDGDVLDDAAEEGPFPAAGDDVPADQLSDLLAHEADERASAMAMDEADWSVDDRDEFDRLPAVSIATESIFDLGPIEDAEELAEQKWALPSQSGGVSPDALDTGAGPTVGRGAAPWAQGRIIRMLNDGSVVGWACDTRNAKQPMVVIASLRNGDGVVTREVVLADEAPEAAWAKGWVKDKCEGQPAHLFRAKLDRTIHSGDKVALKLVGKDGTRVLLEKRVFRNSPIGAVSRFKVRDSEMKKIVGWACDMDTPDERITVEVVSNLGADRKVATDVIHGRGIHLKCNGGVKHRFEMDFDRKVPCGKDEVYRVFAYNTGNPGKDRVLLGKRTVHGGKCDQTPDTVAELAKALLKSPNVTFPYTNDARVVLQELAAGHQAPVSCANNATGTGSRTTVSLSMMKFLYELSKKGVVPINAITDRCHSSYSNHYLGRAVDFACNVNIGTANQVAAKYGGAHNFESCAANAHWHFDF